LRSLLAPAAAPSGALGALRAWKLLGLFNVYRLTLGSLLLVMASSGSGPSLLGVHNRSLFIGVSAFYLFSAAAAAYAIRLRRPSFVTQVHLDVGLDICALTLLMHASGGVVSGLGLLPLISITAASLMLQGQNSLSYAAFASLAILAEQVYSQFNGCFPTTYYTQAGLLGTAYFAAALAAHGLARRATESEALAARRGVDLANMAQLTDYVIQRMQTGVLVMDRVQRVWLINGAGRELLGIPEGSEHERLQDLSPELARRWEQWRRDPELEPGAFRATADGPRIAPRMARLGDGEDAGTLIFLEDTSAMAQQAQHLKLASLGRLTASIAHEIRNPLGAISQAAQLLGESPQLGEADARLTQIIHAQCQRMNEVIANVLQLSRREPSQAQDIQISPWLESFVAEWTEAQPNARIDLDVDPSDLRVRMDPRHLRQVLSNLCQNGLRYSQANTGQARLVLRARLQGSLPIVDVLDSGAGVAPDVAEQMFEPFFTTEPRGTGLGLYMARELCEHNQARLSYLPTPQGGSCFRITFADLRRRTA
jgi:two-component system sensor histidine kinase PilS (NtrC family)